MKLCQKCINELPKMVFDPTIAPEVERVPESECEFPAHKKLNMVGLVLTLEMRRMEEHAKAYHEMFGRGDLDARIAKTNTCKHQHMDLLLDKCLDCGETREFQVWASMEAQERSEK